MYVFFVKRVLRCYMEMLRCIFTQSKWRGENNHKLQAPHVDIDKFRQYEKYINHPKGIEKQLIDVKCCDSEIFNKKQSKIIYS